MSDRDVTKRDLAMLLLILLLGGLFRFYNLNWDQGYMYNPDEMNLAMAVSRVRIPGQGDPGFYAYNGLPIYLYKLAGQLLAMITGEEAWAISLDRIALIGRFIAALVSSVSVCLVFSLGKLYLGRLGGLLAAAFCAWSVGLIQTSHFGTTESLLVFFCC